MPQEIDILSLKTLKNWDLSAAWNRPFTSHPKVFLAINIFSNQHFLPSTIFCFVHIQIIFYVPSQKAPSTGELVTFGVEPTKPFLVVGIISGMFLCFVREKEN